MAYWERSVACVEAVFGGVCREMKEEGDVGFSRWTERGRGREGGKCPVRPFDEFGSYSTVVVIVFDSNPVVVIVYVRYVLAASRRIVPWARSEPS